MGSATDQSRQEVMAEVRAEARAERQEVRAEMRAEVAEIRANKGQRTAGQLIKQKAPRIPRARVEVCKVIRESHRQQGVIYHGI
jgi:F0F1-type ATP synthase membrane subunit b/b'